MNKAGEFKITAMMIALVTAFGLFFGLIGYSMMSLDGQYDTSGYNSGSIEKYNYLTDLSDGLNTSKDIIEGVRVDNNIFDWFAGVWNKLTTPFELIYRSYDNVIDASNDLVTDLKLPPIYKGYIAAVIIILVVVGIVMFKVYLGRKQ